MKDGCPKCGSPLLTNDDDDTQIYRCGTIYGGGMCDSQSPACAKRCGLVDDEGNPIERDATRDEANAIEDQDAYEDAVAWRMRQAMPRNQRDQ